MSYALSTLWYERQRYMPAVLAVAFSCLLIALQCGLLLGLFSITSIPIDESRADIWVGHPAVPSVDLGMPIPEAWQSYLALPEVERTEPYMEGFAYWKKPTGGMELVLVIGTRLGPDSIGAIKQLTPELRTLLSEPSSIVIDEGEFARLGIDKVGDTAEIINKRVRVVGTVKGLRSLAGPYLFCSLDTARKILNPPPGQCTFILAKCHKKSDAPKVVAHLREFPKKLSPFTTEEFSTHSQLHWLFKTKAGIALGLAAALGLLVGAVVTSTTLHAATVASLKEYAVLRALGIPRWRMAMMVISQAFLVGLSGIIVSLPVIFGIAYLGNVVAKVMLPPELLGGAFAITMTMAMCSGLFALRSLRHVEPVTLLR
ncbi:MAG: FtsX-like permease family protein [Planctomycetes bacterium]|nr:FtsX-like permease family protein [Planctomycetota bacterium]